MATNQKDDKTQNNSGASSKNQGKEITSKTGNTGSKSLGGKYSDDKKGNSSNSPKK